MEHNATEEKEMIFTHLPIAKPISFEHFNDPAFWNRNPDDELPSCGGHGTLEALQVIQLLEGAGITCCMVGPSALMYYGAAGRQKVS